MSKRGTTTWTPMAGPRRWSRDQEELIIMVLGALLEEKGGSITLSEAQLGEKGDRVFIDVNENAGLVTLSIIPDYVAIGSEEEQGVDLANGESVTYTVKYDTTPLTLTTANTTMTNATMTNTGGSIIPTAMIDGIVDQITTYDKALTHDQLRAYYDKMVGQVKARKYDKLLLK